MKKGLLLIVLVLLSFQIMFAQKVKVKESNKNIAGSNNNAMEVTIYNSRGSSVMKQWKKLIKNYDPDKVSNKKELFADNVKIHSISDNTIDVYAKFEDEDEESLTFIVAFDLGGVFLNTKDHSKQYSSAERIVYDFAVDMSVKGVQEKIKDQEKFVALTVKKHDKLIKENEYMNKKIEDSQKFIEDTKLKLEENVKGQEETQKEIEKQKEILKKIEKRASELR